LQGYQRFFHLFIFSPMYHFNPIMPMRMNSLWWMISWGIVKTKTVTIHLEIQSFLVDYLGDGIHLVRVKAIVKRFFINYLQGYQRFSHLFVFSTMYHCNPIKLMRINSLWWMIFSVIVETKTVIIHSKIQSFFINYLGDGIYLVRIKTIIKRFFFTICKGIKDFLICFLSLVCTRGIYSPIPSSNPNMFSDIMSTN